MKNLIKTENQAIEKSSNLNDRLASLADLARQANKNPKKLKDLQTFLAKNLDLREKIALMAGTVKSGLVTKLAKESGTQAVLRAEMEGMKESLVNQDSTPLELLLIEAIVLCWMRVQYAESYRTLMINENYTLTQLEFAEKQLTRAHNRYFKALETLARLRRLNQPKKSDSLDRSLKAMKLLNTISHS